MNVPARGVPFGEENYAAPSSASVLGAGLKSTKKTFPASNWLNASGLLIVSLTKPLGVHFAQVLFSSPATGWSSTSCDSCGPDPQLLDRLVTHVTFILHRTIIA